MRRRARKVLVPLLLVGLVAGISFALFGAGPGTARAGAAPLVGTGSGNAAPTSTLPAGANRHALGNTGGTRYQDNELGTGAKTGKQMYVQSCSACHGTDAQGSARAPTLVGLGAATVDFWVSTGRMPLQSYTQQATRKPPEYNFAQAKAIAQYVASLGPGGPPIPKVDLAHANLQQGGELFRLNCATCHSFLAVGGALSYGAFAPSLYPDTPTQIAEAIRTGPGNMPRFSTSQLSQADMNDIIRYVKYIVAPDDHGGFALGHIGPTAEGYVAIVIGVGFLMLAAFWIGDRI